MQGDQALVNDILRDMLGQHVFVYLDDILFFILYHPPMPPGELPLHVAKHMHKYSQKYTSKHAQMTTLMYCNWLGLDPMARHTQKS